MSAPDRVKPGPWTWRTWLAVGIGVTTGNLLVWLIFSLLRWLS